MSRPVTARRVGPGRYEIRPRQRWVSRPVRHTAWLVLGAGCVAGLWHLATAHIGATDADGVAVLAALAAVTCWRLRRATRR